jgi:hypothetical protein
MLVLDHLELGLDGESPAADGSLTTVNHHLAATNRDPNKSTPAGQELDARLLECDLERLDVVPIDNVGVVGLLLGRGPDRCEDP